MSKHKYTINIPRAMPVLALLISLVLLAACSSDSDSSPQATPDVTINVAPDNSDGFDCAGVNQIPAVECQALVALYDSTGGPDWIDNNGWLGTSTPCDWTGINCTGGHVSHINLLYNELTGTLPPELGNLSHLYVLGLWVNRLHGPIPAELGKLSELGLLDLSDNQLTGPLPAELGRLTDLQIFSVADNQLDGSIPSGLGRMASLESLDLSYNQLGGPIPPELGDLANLGQLRLSHNQLSGSIPASLGNLNQIYDLDLSYNQLSGSMPESLTHVAQRRLWGNQLEETIVDRGQEPIVVDYEGIHFVVDPSLAESIRPDVIPATLVLEGEPIWYAAPEHVRFTFVNPPLVPGRFQMGINLPAEAQILIYPLDDLAAIDPWVREQIEALQGLLAENGPLPEGELPLLPNTNASQMFHSQAQHLESSSIQGLRFITQHTQESIPVNNQRLIYTFQGFTDDGAYYVAAFFPVITAVLPDKIEVDDWEAFSAGFATYLSETTAVLDQLSPTDFTPDLALLDAVITSLQVEPNGTLFGTETAASPLHLVASSAGLAY